MRASKVIFISAVIVGLTVGHGDHQFVVEQQQPHRHTVQRTAVSTEAADKQSCNYYSCTDCATATGCGWCDSSSTCQVGNTYGPYSGLCSTWRYSASSCPGYSDICSPYTSCSSCTSQGSCGWCASTQTCFQGSSTGPTYSTCPSSSWSWYSSSCSSSSCTCSLYEVYSCPTGYNKKGDWCETDKCCGTLFDCCTPAPWLIASSVISPLALISACILACCFGCSGCPGYNSRMRRQQAAMASYQQQGTYMPAARAQAVPTMPQPVYSTVTEPLVVKS